jgi:glycosyltransferase involved in cell wall biosynthesis
MNKKDIKMRLSIIMPALNEESSIRDAIDDTLGTFDDYGIKGEIILVNDGSTDDTLKIIKEEILKDPERIRVINHNVPLGIGASFWDGLDYAQGDVICMLPADNENEPREIMRYLGLLEHVDMVIPFVYNKSSRSWLRNTLSSIYRFIINNTFLISLNYTNGAVLYRKSILNELGYRCRGFFFQTDIVVRLLRKGYLFAEVPYRLRSRIKGESKAISFFSFWQVTKAYLKLVLDVYFLRRDNKTKPFSPTSVTAKRYNRLGV